MYIFASIDTFIYVKRGVRIHLYVFLHIFLYTFIEISTWLYIICTKNTWGPLRSSQVTTEAGFQWPNSYKVYWDQRAYTVNKMAAPCWAEGETLCSACTSGWTEAWPHLPANPKEDRRRGRWNLFFAQQNSHSAISVVWCQLVPLCFCCVKVFNCWICIVTRWKKFVTKII